MSIGFFIQLGGVVLIIASLVLGDEEMGIMVIGALAMGIMFFGGVAMMFLGGIVMGIIERKASKEVAGDLRRDLDDPWK